MGLIPETDFFCRMDSQMEKNIDKADRMIELSIYAQKLIRIGLFHRAEAVLKILQEEHGEIL